MRLLAALAIMFGALTQPAEAKTFRHYYGLQWEFEPTELPHEPIFAVVGETLFQTRLLPTALYELDADFRENGRLLVGKGTQLAPAVSALTIRCTLGPGESGSLSFDRRVCVMDLDKDGTFDAWFDEGLGMEMAQLQFTGCAPVAPAKAVVPTMSQRDVKQTRWPFLATIKLGMYKIRAGKPAEFRFDVVVKRADKPALSFTLCKQGYLCRWAEGSLTISPGGLAFRPTKHDATHARFDVIQPFRRTGYHDMSPANRPDPIYCPGTLFVKTDQHDHW